MKIVWWMYHVQKNGANESILDKNNTPVSTIDNYLPKKARQLLCQN